MFKANPTNKIFFEIDNWINQIEANVKRFRLRKNSTPEQVAQTQNKKYLNEDLLPQLLNVLQESDKESIKKNSSLFKIMHSPHVSIENKNKIDRIIHQDVYEDLNFHEKLAAAQSLNDVAMAIDSAKSDLSFNYLGGMLKNQDLIKNIEKLNTKLSQSRKKTLTQFLASFKNDKPRFCKDFGINPNFGIEEKISQICSNECLDYIFSTFIKKTKSASTIGELQVLLSIFQVDIQKIIPYLSSEKKARALALNEMITSLLPMLNNPESLDIESDVLSILDSYPELKNQIIGFVSQYQQVSAKYKEALIQTPIELSKPLLALVSRLETKNLFSDDHPIRKLISEEDLKIINHYLVRALTIPNIQNTQFEILKKHLDILTHINTLTPGKSVRLDKTQTKLPRSITLICDKNGELKVLLETKSKIAIPDKKQNMPVAQGATKKGKPAWRIDADEPEYINLVANLPNERKLERLKYEINISKEFADHPHLLPLEKGPVYLAKPGSPTKKKMSLYAQKATHGNLHEFIKSDDYKALSEKEQLELMLKICEGVKAIHDSNKVHQDLKPENIVIFKVNNVYIPKIIDFGNLSTHLNPKMLAIATRGYQSPELTYLHLNHPKGGKIYFTETMKPNDLSKNLVPTYSEGEKNQLIYPHKANDMWALGIIYFEMLYGKTPTHPGSLELIENNTLLKSLLTAKREDRAEIEQAIAIVKENILQLENPGPSQKITPI
jgi:hypothetical protein